MTHDLSAARADILHGRLSAADAMARSRSAAASPACAAAYLHRFDASSQATEQSLAVLMGWAGALHDDAVQGGSLTVEALPRTGGKA